MFTQATLETKTGPELVEIFNGLPGVKQVKRFTNRETGVRRILEASLENQRPEANRRPPQPEDAPKKRGRKKEPRGTYNLKGGDNKRSYRESSGRGQMLAILTTTGATFDELVERFPQWNADKIHGTIKNVVATWLGFDVTTDDNGVIRASREV